MKDKRERKPEGAMPAATGDDEFYTVARLAELTGLAPFTVRKWCWQHRLPSFKLGGRRLIRKRDVQELLARCRQDADPAFELGK